VQGRKLAPASAGERQIMRSPYLSPMVGACARAATIKVMPRGSNA
jgi:hypothetical protein